MANLASNDPNDISNHLARLIDAKELPDGSYVVRARLQRDMPHRDGFIRSLQVTLVHKLGVGTWVEGPISEPHGSDQWAWGGRYRPEPVDIPHDPSGLEELH